MATAARREGRTLKPLRGNLGDYWPRPPALVTLGLWGAGGLLAFVAVIPLVFALYLARSLSLEGALVGLSDPRHLAALANSVTLGIGMAVALVSLALVLIVALHRALTPRIGPLLLVLAGWTLLFPDYVFGIAVRSVIDPTIGALRGLVSPAWFLSHSGALFIVGAAGVAKWLPFAVALLFARLQASPLALMEQGRLDFDSWHSAMRFVYLPALRPTLSLLGVLAFLLGFRQHEMVTELVSSGAGFTSETWSLWNQRTMFEFARFDLAAVQALATLPLLAVAVLVARATALDRKDR